MKVYVVYCHEEYECYPPQAAFDCREKAEEYLNCDPDLFLVELELE